MSRRCKGGADPATRTPFAVVDVGSNSVRLVVYDGLRRDPHVLFNEKVLCGLGAAVARSGEMEEAAMARAAGALRRFALLIEAMRVGETAAVATAAVREARNGAAFLRRIAAETGIVVRLLDGGEEARLSALGVLSGIPDADGIMGDLGGGSLELVRIGGGGIAERVTLPIGTLALLARFGDDRRAMARAVRDALEEVPWLRLERGGDFYIVGGNWRALSRLHMAQERAPLPILHGYRLPGKRARTLAKLVSRQHPESLAGVADISAGRLATVPTAALVLHRLLARMRPRAVVTSALGLREGLLFDRLSPALRTEDPFLAAAREIARDNGRFPEHGDTLMSWIDPLFDGAETPAMRRLRHGACLLADIAWRGHPDFRAERAVMEVLYGRFIGIDHRGRGFIALALNRAYGGDNHGPLARQCRALLEYGDEKQALRVGAALRLAQRISGGTGDLLARCPLLASEDGPVLAIAPGYEALMSPVVARRLKALNALLDRPITLRVGTAADTP